MTPFVPALPPRDLTGGPAKGQGRKNPSLQSLDSQARQHPPAISFPSAHVASTMAVSLVLLHFTPAVGTIFLLVAIWIALGAVIGRYHYALDVLLGAATALAVFLACYPYL